MRKSPTRLEGMETWRVNQGGGATFVVSDPP